VCESIVEPVLREFAPQLTLVSAGYDAHERDPLASMRVSTAGYALMIGQLRRTALGHGAFALVTEGGYDLTALAQSLEASFAAIAGAGPAYDSNDSSPRGRRAVEVAYQIQRTFWKGL
jgi:acetoin utilization deacetylase AcuC-like enzyme